MIFEQGKYYVGDPGFVLGSDDLRSLFAEIISLNGLQSGAKNLLASRQYGLEHDFFEPYFVAKLPHYSGTLYDKDNNGWGFEWGAFGAVPWNWIENQDSYSTNCFEFTEPFKCSFTNNSVTIGHLHFTLNPQ